MYWSPGPRSVHPQGDDPAPGYRERSVQLPGLGVGLRRGDPCGAGAPERPRSRGGQDGQVSGEPEEAMQTAVLMLRSSSHVACCANATKLKSCSLLC